MTSRSITLVIAIHCMCLVTSLQRSYQGDTLLRLHPTTAQQRSIIQGLLQQNQQHINVWRSPHHFRKSIDLHISAKVKDHVLQRCRWSNIGYHTVIPDIQNVLDESYAFVQADRSEFDLNSYHTYEEITDWLHNIAAECGPYCHLSSLGNSTEHRQLTVLQIGDATSGKPIIWLDAGLHAREWIGPATALNIIHALVIGSRSDPELRMMSEQVTWYILPLGNPDGYKYTWVQDRLWRKTRSQNGRQCVGVDPNRNWDYHWGEGDGSSDDPCSECYAGPDSFSEPETVAIATFLLNIQHDLKAYISLHSYGQDWLTPWGYTTELPSDYEKMMDVATRATEAALLVSDTNYTIGSAANVLYSASGTSEDWVKGVLNIPYTFTVELAGVGDIGFILPKKYIPKTGIEMIASLKSIAQDVHDEYRGNNVEKQRN